jgi:putative addiction module component (TIGR02574 family)
MDPKTLLEEALRLPEKARLALAGELFESVENGDLDESSEKAWDSELQRRVEAIDSGLSTSTPGPDVHAELEAKIKRGRGL